INGRVPVAHQALVATLVSVGPDDFVFAWLDAQQGAADAVRLGNEDLVPDDHRVTGVDALQDWRPPGEVEIDLAGPGFKAEQPAAGEDEAPAPAVDGRQHGTGIARQLVGDAVLDLAGELVERDDPAAVALLVDGGKVATVFRTAADLDDQQVALDHGRR